MVNYIRTVYDVKMTTWNSFRIWRLWIFLLSMMMTHCWWFTSLQPGKCIYFMNYLHNVLYVCNLNTRCLIKVVHKINYCGCLRCFLILYYSFMFLGWFSPNDRTWLRILMEMKSFYLSSSQTLISKLRCHSHCVIIALLQFLLI